MPEPLVSGAPGGMTIRVADERDLPALAALRRVWAEERAGETLADGGFEQTFATWWRTEQPRRTFWLAEVGTERVGVRAVGSLNVAEVVSMPRPGQRAGRWGYVGNAFVLDAFRAHGAARRLLAAAVAHARQQGYQRLVLSPTAGSAEFYHRAGFRAAGADLLLLPTER